VNNNHKKDKGAVVVAMSGGVDSSTTAYLLKEQGYDVIGITMRLYDEFKSDKNSDRPCCSITMASRAAAVCRLLGVPHYVVDFREEFKRSVVDDFYRKYLSGMTPNPCVRCNTYVKWETLVKKKNMIGAEYIATGHYAQVIRNPATGKCELHKGIDNRKDQSYFLWGLTGEHLEFTLFPLGELTKKQVRERAAQYKLPTAQTTESMEICFIPDNDYRNFIIKRLQQEGRDIPAGEFRDTGGSVIGTHNGFHNFTIGQRKKLGISLGKKLFVTQIVPDENVVVVGSEDEILAQSLSAHAVNWINGIPVGDDVYVDAKIRYRDPGTPAQLKPGDNNTVTVYFKRDVSAVTPGQSVVFYKGDRVIGGGVISGRNS